VTDEETPRSFTPDSDVVAEYRALAENGFADGTRGKLLLVVSTADLTWARGDLYVALGLAKYLRREGWGITLWPTERWTEQTPEGFDAAIVMIETFVPGLVHPDTQVIAWVRNWTERWAELPYLDAFGQIWCSSEASATCIREVYEGPVDVVPLGTDPELFTHVPVEREPAVVTTANFWGVERGLIAALKTLAEQEKVTWFGKNARFLELPPAIDHRHTIDYFMLPWVYSAWQFVIDDVIDAAAVYGTQNSRLFDAISSGAIVITNTSNGLAELGLDDVPTYSGPQNLADVVAELRNDSSGTAELSARLTTIVHERHSYAVRAAAVTALLERPRRASAERSALLAWTTLMREDYRTEQFAHADLQVLHYDLSREFGMAQRRIHLLENLIENQPGRRLRRYARYLLRPRALIARLRASRATPPAPTD
jgi:hypothetical protein